MDTEAILGSSWANQARVAFAGSASGHHHKTLPRLWAYFGRERAGPVGSLLHCNDDDDVHLGRDIGMLVFDERLHVLGGDQHSYDLMMWVFYVELSPNSVDEILCSMIRTGSESDLFGRIMCGELFSSLATAAVSNL